MADSCILGGMIVQKMVAALTEPVVPLLSGLAQFLGGTAQTGLLHGLGVLSLAVCPIVGLNLSDAVSPRDQGDRDDRQHR